MTEYDFDAASVNGHGTSAAMFHSGPVRFHASLRPLMVGIDEVTPYPDNYNNGDVEAIAESIEVNGIYRPLFIQRDTGYIVAGNHTWYAAKHLGAEQIPVVLLDVTDHEALRIMIADNRTAALARPDTTLLLDLLNRLADTEYGVSGTGYHPPDLDQLAALAQMEPAYDEYATWPTLCFTIPPHLKVAFETLTTEALDMRDKFEVLLRLAGWGAERSGT